MIEGHFLGTDDHVFTAGERRIIAEVASDHLGHMLFPRSATQHASCDSPALRTLPCDHDPVAARVTRLVGVYDADGTVLGELSYFVRTRFGRAHCDLCDITHGRVRERAAWRTCRDELPVPFETFHRDDQPDEVRSTAGGEVPTVAAELDDGTFTVLLGASDLAACAGSPAALVAQVERAMEQHQLGF